MALLAKGFYRGKATHGEFGSTATKGTDFVRVFFEILDGESAGQRIYWDGYFTENTIKRTVDALRYCGCTFPDNDVTNLTGLGTSEVQLDVDHESYEDKDGNPKTVARVNWVNSLIGGVKPELLMGDAKKAEFRAKMMGHVALSKQSKPGAQSAAGANPPANGGDKIPF